MKSFFATLLLCLFFTSPFVYCQTAVPAPGIDKVQFFKEESQLKVSLESYWGNLINKKNKIGLVFPGRFKGTFPDGKAVDENVDLVVRGHFRREYCNLPPIKLQFKKSPTSVMAPLKSLKLVNVCKLNGSSEQNLLKEYLIYKMYNLLTDKSYRVRLLNVDFVDSSGKKGPGAQPAFLVEDLSDLAKRNDCKEWNKRKVHAESTDSKQMTLVSIFEYMIGNTDWSVPGDHNIKLIQIKSDSNSLPFAVPYDFDFSGIINTDYATPDPMLNTETVTERVYRGFPRTMEEINEVLDIFKQKKDQIYAVVNNFELLNSGSKKGMINYLESFYSLINKPKEVKSVFIDNARKQ